MTRRSNPRRRRLRWIGLGGLGIALIIIQYGTLWWHDALTHDDLDSTQSPSGRVILMGRSPEMIDAAKTAVESGGTVILLRSDHPPPSVRVGVTEDAATAATRILTDAGVSNDAIEVWQTSGRTPHAAWRYLDRIGRLDRGVTVLCPEIASARTRRVIDQALQGRSSREHVQVRGVAIAKLDRDHWHRSREGVKVVLSQTLRLIFVAVVGESDVRPDEPYEDVLPTE